MESNNTSTRTVALVGIQLQHLYNLFIVPIPFLSTSLLSIDVLSGEFDQFSIAWLNSREQPLKVTMKVFPEASPDCFVFAILKNPQQGTV